MGPIAISSNTLDLKEFFGTEILGTREQGQLLRCLLADRINTNELTVCDFSNVDVMTSAFADECFGKLWDTFSHPLLKKMIRITGMSPNNQAVFHFVLAHR
ncbi:STAS-like domain-containing protein [Sulfobacillus thermosulfidooxidans]|uniref:STAS-like domain-containing protein n=1 Tax=Sulfobacillus thermosulfidooxidans TaxID=28034 RepID=UPI00048B4BA2|nr:STAS-like domain-containing protein [Sulfobacillus thermosulfidooxidans]